MSVRWSPLRWCCVALVCIKVSLVDDFFRQDKLDPLQQPLPEQGP